MSTSREYAKFKRLFVGPLLPRKIRRLRSIGFTPPMPIEKLGVVPVKTTPRIYNSKIEKLACQTAYQAEKKKKRDKSMPIWANRDIIEQLYIQARLLTEETGIKHDVDHIIPAKHPLVCGLHVENNLQILTKFDNLLKSNKFEI
jgi:hypothetical protein